MIRLIGTDLDGTLLDDKKMITLKNRLAIRKAVLKGVKVVITTGRPMCDTMINYYKDLNLYQKNEYMIGFNGAVIYDIYTQEVIYENTITGKDVKKLKEFAKKFEDVYTHIYKENTVYYEDINKYTLYEQEVNKVEMKQINYDEFANEDKIIKFMIVGDEEKLDKVVEHLDSNIKNEYTILRSMPFYLEFVNKDVNKYVGLKELARRLKIEDDEIMAIGDNLNDYHMVKHAFMGIAMKNAVEEVKEIARYITKSNNESGVAYAIDTLILDEN